MWCQTAGKYTQLHTHYWKQMCKCVWINFFFFVSLFLFSVHFGFKQNNNEKKKMKIFLFSFLFFLNNKLLFFDWYYRLFFFFKCLNMMIDEKLFLVVWKKKINFENLAHTTLAHNVLPTIDEWWMFKFSETTKRYELQNQTVF